MEAFAALVQIAAARPDGDAGESRDSMEDRPLAIEGGESDGEADGCEAVGGVVAAPVLAELAVVAAIAQQRGVKRYDRGGWQLLKHARDVKRSKAAEQGKRHAEAKHQATSAVLALVQEEFPCVASVVGLRAAKQRNTMTLPRAVIVQRLALKPAIRGKGPTRLVQARALSVMAMAGRCTERLYFEKSILQPEPDGGVATGSEQLLDLQFANSMNRIAVLAWQWDET